MQDIHGQLEAQEIVAWQNLIRVLTHEIVNSVTPVSSLASTATELLTRVRDGVSDAEAIRDAREAVDTISKRSVGLLNFVENYRRLTRIPAPTFQIFEVRDLVFRIDRLMRQDLERDGIAFRSSVEPLTLELNADPELLEQALINLIRNAVDAVEGVTAPRIHLSGEASPKGRVILAVEDNGRGMPDEVKESIFVPFFTTKRHGTGIGLTLVRQIVRSHQGSINVRSADGEGTNFQLAL
jgi:signal transduction histidine kinase